MFAYITIRSFVVDNISKIVLSQTSGEVVGYILDIAIDFQEFVIKGYYVVDEETESELFLKKEDVVVASDFVIMIEDVSKLEFSSSRPKSLIGRFVFDDRGVFLGKIVSLKFHKSKLEKILTDKCEILTRHIKNVGNDVVMVEFKKKRKTQSKREFPKLQGDGLVQIQSSQGLIMPEKVTLSSSFYVGKVVGEDIFGYNNERIISKGETISKNVVAKAKKHNRLNQLFFAIKR